MHHFFDTITNTSGDSLIGYFARVIDPATQLTVTLASDESGTPISTVSGVTDMAKTDDYGNLDFYVAPGTYHLDVYASDATTFRYRVSNVGMESVQGAQGPQGVQGDTGPANSTYPTLAALKGADISNLSAILTLAGSEGVFNWTTGNFTGQNDDINVVKADSTALSVGAWVRQKSAAISFLQSGTGAVARTVQDKGRDVLNAADFLPIGYVVDGSVDYTVQLQKAVDEALSTARTLMFPPGIFTVSGSGLSIVLATNKQLDMVGHGALNTFIRSSTGNVLRVQGQFLNVRDIGFRGEGGGHVVLQTGLLAQCTWNRVYIAQNADGYSVWANAGQEFIENRFNHCVLQHTTSSTVYGFDLSAAGGLINDNSWNQCRIQHSGTKHFFNIENTTANSHFANAWHGLNFEVCLGGGIRLRGANGFIIDDCQNWDADAVPIANDFYDLGTALGIGCIGRIVNCGRWAGTMAGGKYDVKLPGGGGGAGIIIENCRAVGGGDSFSIDAASNGFVLNRVSSALTSTVNGTGATLIESASGIISVPVEFQVGGVKVVGSRGAAVPDASGGATVDAEARAAINALLARLRAHGLIS